MNLLYLKEDNLPQRFPVKFSTKISDQINKIYEYNKSNSESISKWLDYIEWLQNYISNRSIAWDYANQHLKFPNGTRFISKFNIGYTVKSDTQGTYVYIFILDLKIEEYGLKAPTSLQEQVIKQLRHQQNKLSTDEYCRILLECYDVYLHNLFI